VNGYVLAWMAVSSSASGALGILAGRKLEFRNAYRMGRETGRMMAEYDAQYGEGAVASAAKAHGHSPLEACTMACYDGSRKRT
jgi:hypothetical protein